MAEKDFIEVNKYVDFLEFYNAIQPFGEYGILQKYFVFRGVSDSSYQLLPSALRTNNIENLRLLASFKDDSDTLYGRYLQEISAVCEFYRKANENALPIPSVNEFMITDLLSFLRSNGASILGKELIQPVYYEIIALAQHYGMPTRFLDWTKDINVAIYFAVRDICVNLIKDKDIDINNLVYPEKKFSIWMLNIHFFRTHSIKNLNLKFIEPPYINNKNLNAQKGVFSLDNITLNNFKEEELAIPLEEKILNIEETANTTKEPLLYKFNIPYNQVVIALMLLHSIGYTYSRIYPDLNNVKDDILECKLWGCLK